MATPNNTNEQINKAADAGRNAADAAAHTARVASDEAARVGEQTAHAGAEVFRRGTETARDTVQAGLNTATQNFQRITDQFTQVLGFNGPQSEELARRSSQNLQAVTQASTVLARGFQDISREWTGLLQGQMQKNIDAVNRIAGCRSVQDVVAVQSELVRDNLQQTIDTGRRIGEVSVRVANEAARTMQTQVGSTATQAHRAA